MIALPSIVMLGALAWLSMLGALILRRRSHQYIALGCAVVEVMGALILAVM